MINSVQLKNFGPVAELDWQNLGPINLVIGNNGCGKSFLMKAMYSAVRTLEEYKRGDNPKSVDGILLGKLYWTFQSGTIGALVTKPGDSSLMFSLVIDQRNFSYSFGRDARKKIDSLHNDALPRPNNSIFLPAKEVLSLHGIILKSRERDLLYGFDDTYFDLAKALQLPATHYLTFDPDSFDTTAVGFIDNQNSPLQQSRHLLEKMIGGIIEFDENANRWYFNKGGQRFLIGVTAEGINKIAILDTLLGNGYLSKNSIIFIDEPEATLHPEAISKLLDIIALLAKYGIQFFIASHSYFVVKKLFLIAQQNKLSIPVLSKENEVWRQADLLEDMPDNPIIQESTRLFQEEVNLPTWWVQSWFKNLVCRLAHSLTRVFFA